MRNFALIIFAIASTLGTYSATAQIINVTSSSPPEAKLASIDHGTRSLAASKIRRYATSLDKLEPRCKQSRINIADMTVASCDELLKRYAKRTTLLEFLEAAFVKIVVA